MEASDPKRNYFCVPIQVQAFQVNEDFPSTDYRIAPLVQPDYSKLRPQAGVLGNDVVDQLDLSEASLRASTNSRFVNLMTGQVRQERVGIYLSWCLPKGYRTAISSTESAADNHSQNLRESGFPTTGQGASSIDPGLSHFRPVPDRWLIFRIPVGADAGLEGWQRYSYESIKIFLGAQWQPEIYVLESNRVRNLNDRDLQPYRNDGQLLDVENIMAPFVDADSPQENQYEMFLGFKTLLKNYDPAEAATRRVPLTVVEGANELFADYQPHNSSVFSLFDDLGYSSFPPGQKIEDAVYSYFVCGFHADLALDPLATPPPSAVRPRVTQVLDAMSIDITKPERISEAAWAKGLESLTQDPTYKNSIICHGFVDNVRFMRGGWDRELTKPSVEIQKLVRRSHPVAVGHGPLDALLAYMRFANTDTNGVDQAVTLLEAWEPLILEGDDVASQIKAEDTRIADEFHHSPGGSAWHLVVADQKEATGGGGSRLKGLEKGSPAAMGEVAADLRLLNGFQASCDAAEREIQHLRQELWCEWWKSSTDKTYDEGTGRIRVLEIKARIEAIQRHVLMSNFAGTMEFLKSRIRNQLQDPGNMSATSLDLERGRQTSFQRPSDPTVLFAGIPSGWPRDYGGRTSAKLLSNMPFVFRDSFYQWCSGNTVKEKFPEHSKAVNDLLGVWAGTYNDNMLRTLFDIRPQAWFPLFIEWEVEYYHIPWDSWEFVSGRDGIFSYRIKKNHNLRGTKAAADCRVLAGRSNISPEAARVLRDRIRQLKDKLSPEEVQSHMGSDDAIKGLLSDAINMEYFSTTLDGLGNHMVTMAHGTHVSATISSGQGRPLQSHDGIIVGDVLGITPEDLLAIGSTGADDLTPYGSNVPISSRYKAFSPFKPVTHGQVRFTKLTMVDKFGQVVTCIDPPDSKDGNHYALYPCISPALSCSALDETKSPPVPNTVIAADDNTAGACQFFQLPPRINQETRLNISPLIQDSQGADLSFRLASDWESPIWGWIFIDYPDQSLKTYRSDGTMVAELVLMPGRTLPVLHTPGKLGLPEGDPAIAAHNDARIMALTRQLAASEDLCNSLFQVLSAALSGTISLPTHYPSFLAPALGRPFVLVDFGLSMELARPPATNQSLLCPAAPDVPLTSYRFRYKLGSGNAGFDGLVAYSAPLGDGTLARMRTDYADQLTTTGGGVFGPVADHPSLAPFFLPADTLDREHSMLTGMDKYTAVVDPFVPLHVYTGGVLPPAPLELPGWAIEQAMRRIAASFRAGPLVVPSLDLAPEVAVGADAAEAPKIQVATPPFGDWKWVQPTLPIAPGTAGSGAAVAPEPVLQWVSCQPTPMEKGIRVGDGGAPVIVQGWFREDIA